MGTLAEAYEALQTGERLELIGSHIKYNEDTPFFMIKGTDLYIQKDDHTVVKNGQIGIHCKERFDAFYVKNHSTDELIFASYGKGVFDANGEPLLKRKYGNIFHTNQETIWGVNGGSFTHDQLEIYKNDTLAYTGSYLDNYTVRENEFAVKPLAIEETHKLLRNGNPNDIMYESHRSFDFTLGKTVDDFYIINGHQVLHKGEKALNIGPFEEFYFFDTDKYLTVRNRNFYLNQKCLYPQSGEAATSAGWMPYRFIITPLGIVQFHKRGCVHLTVIK
jgi:hypothetical protein